MEKKESPFRLIFVVLITIIVFAGLIGLYLQSPDGVLHWLATIGICGGVVWLIFLAGAIYGVIEERKNRLHQARAAERLKRHQARFSCHICGKPSPQPYQYWEEDGENGRLYGSFLVTDEDKPTDLVQCARCRQWTCSNADPPHLENGVCKKCLEQPPEQGE